jgi:hypothetical protein
MTDQASKAGNAARGGVARRSRRQLLAGGSGALAAVLTAEALARTAPAAAANGDPVILGHANKSTGLTSITNSTGGRTALACFASGSGDAVRGTTISGTGVLGTSGTGDGVSGASVGGNGVAGSSPKGTGVRGAAGNGTGVLGVVGGIGTGVAGVSEGTGDGVSGASAGGTGVVAWGKTALQVHGPAVFSRSGILTVEAGHSSAQQTGIALTSASFVLATIQGNVGGVHVQGVTLVTGSSGSFNIHLNKAVLNSVKVAWFAVN